MSITRKFNKKASIITAILALVLQPLIVAMPAMAAFSSKYPSNVSNTSGTGTYDWNNVNNVKVDDSNYATVTLPGGGLATSRYIKANGYGFSIPDNASIDGIQVKIGRSTTGNQAPFIRDNEIKLVRNNAIESTNKANTTTDWPKNNIEEATYGNPTDKWGASWAANEINNSGFGVVLSAKNANTDPDRDRTASVDYVSISVFYTEPIATTTTITPPTIAVPYGTSFSVSTSVMPSSATGTVNIKEGSTVLGSATIAGGSGTANISASSSAANLPVGNHDITGTYVGDSTHSSSTSTTSSITITKADTIAQITNGTELASATDQDSPYTVKWSVNNANPGGAGTPTGTVTISGGSGCSANVNAGQCDLTSITPGPKFIVATYSGDSNFNGSISTTVPHNVTDIYPPSIVPHDDINNIEATSSSGAPVTYTTPTAVDAYDGSVPVNCLPASGSTFNLGQTTVNCSAADIAGNTSNSSFKITVVDTTPPMVILNGNSEITLEYGDTFTDPGATWTDIVDTSGTVTDITGTVDNLALGDYKISYKYTDNSGNSDSKDRIVHVVRREVTATADTQTKVYGETDPKLTYQITYGSLVGDNEFTGELEREAGENVGTYEIKQGTLALNDNYDLTFVSDDFIVTPAQITVTINNASKVFGAKDPTFTYKITSGKLIGDDKFTGNLDRADGETAGQYEISKGDLTLGDNYEITFKNGILTILAAPAGTVLGTTTANTSSTPVVSSSSETQEAADVGETLGTETQPEASSTSIAKADTSDKKDSTNFFTNTILGVYTWVWLLIIAAGLGIWWFAYRRSGEK